MALILQVNRPQLATVFLFQFVNTFLEFGVFRRIDIRVVYFVVIGCIKRPPLRNDSIVCLFKSLPPSCLSFLERLL